MKKNFFLTIVAVLLFGSAAFFFGSCDKDTNCYVRVSVRDQVTDTLGVTTEVPVSGAYVKIDIDSSMISSEGYTNASGVYETMFRAPALFNVAVKYIVIDTPAYPVTEFVSYRKGNSNIHLKEGDTVFTTVYLGHDVIHESLH